MNNSEFLNSVNRDGVRVTLDKGVYTVKYKGTVYTTKSIAAVVFRIDALLNPHSEVRKLIA